jgi:hypothetical protein
VAKSRIAKTWLQPRATTSAALPLVIVARSAKKTRKRDGSASLHPSAPEFWTVINEIADPTPIATAELDAIERYFSAVLDDVFAPSRKTSP